MNTSMNMNRFALALPVLLVAAGAMTACDRKDAAAPLTPSAAVFTAPSAVGGASGPVTGGVPDGSLPDTSAALAKPGVAPAANASPPSTMTRDQESKAMPLPGQVNDHSTPAPSKAKGN